MGLVSTTPNLSIGIKLECMNRKVTWVKFIVGLSSPWSIGGRGLQKPCILSHIRGVHGQYLEVCKSFVVLMITHILGKANKTNGFYNL
jgi:hypothetical protein